MSTDARTTPRALRLPLLALLVLLGGYEAWCWKYALGDGEPNFARWLATWQMFTLKDPTTTLVEAEEQVDGTWKAIDLEVLFPTRWESGPRYARSSFWQSPARMRVLAAATCGRSPEHPTRVRFTSSRWKKTLGSVEQPRKKVETKELIDWPCDRAVQLPKGTLL